MPVLQRGEEEPDLGTPGGAFGSFLHGSEVDANV